MNKHLDSIIQNKIKRLMFEQDSMEPSTETPESKVSPFSPEEQKFLGHFAKTGSRQLGILYSISDVGVREFIARSGNQLSCTPNILIGLLKRKYIKIIPYTGLGRNTDYTIELQLSLKSVEPFKDLAGAEAGADAAGGDMGGGDMGGGDMGGGMPPPPPPDAGGGAPPEEPAAEPAPEVAHVVKYGNLLKESAKITKQLIKELKSKKKSPSLKDIKIHVNKSRILRRVPNEFIYQLRRVIHQMLKRSTTKTEQERLIADILDNLQVNFNLTDDQVLRSFNFHRNQKILQKLLDKE